MRNDEPRHIDTPNQRRLILALINMRYEKEARERALASSYPTACDGHVGTTEESYGLLANRYEENPVGFIAELAKKNAERKLMHEILTDAGVPSLTSHGRDLCLLARVAILAEMSR